jgi:hypothetical protein
MTVDLDIINTSSIVIVPIVIGVVQGIKLTGWLKEGWTPLVSMLVGVLISLVAGHDSRDYMGSLLGGVMYGLMASGLYSGVKTMQDAAIQAKEQRAREEQEMKSKSNCTCNEKPI